ncbi:MAG TPA: ATP-dependent Clp protease ATP-binding subunit [Candidatus Paceibacterota bacterium]|nr:ATP-dependent Clp protease ATP-binding subunit [Candidatus Paceibacterota bacterium]
METKPNLQIAFHDPRLGMSFAGRLLVRVMTWIVYLVVAAAAFTFLISGMARLRFIGVFLALFLLDLFIHRGQGDLPIAELPKAGAVNIARIFRPSAFGALERAFDSSMLARRGFFLEMTERLLEYPEVVNGLRRLDVPPADFRQKLDEFIGASPAAPVPKAELLKSAEVLAIAAFGQALAAGHDFVEVSDLFSALPKVGDANVDRLFNLFAVEPGDIERALIFSSGARARGLGGLPAMLGGFVLESHRHIRHRVMNRAWTSRPTPTLDAYGTDFTDLARDRQIGFLIGHEAEYEQLVETLARPTNPNALLVGDAGIGKEAVVQHLAFRLAKDDVPRALFDKRLVSLELQGLVAGATPDVLNARLKTIVEEIYLAGNIIVYIPDIHNLVKTSGNAYLSAADALMPVIMNNSFPIVGATYPKEFKEFIEPRSDFVGAFEIIRVNEIAPADAEKVLTYESMILERQGNVTISFGAVKRAVELAKKYLHGKFLPSSAEELLKSAVVDAERRGEKQVGPDLVTAVAEAKTHIPIHEAQGEEAEKLLNMEDIIHKRLVDQEEAVKAVATALREYRSGLARKGGPIASFLFVGPTGVGKTELAKILADIQFGSEKLMTRFDMTEYQDKASFARFIGSPDGQTRGALTDAVLEKPYSLVLLDEFEKAFPDILNLFLQVLDDGRLTDGLGRTVDFTNTIVIATSNAHSDIINDALGKGESMTDIAEYLKKRLVDVFKPELINRFSKVIIFKNLEPKELGQIVLINLQEFADTVKEQGISIEFSPEAVAQLVKLGYDPAFGARPLRRVIEEKIRAPLAEAILAKKVAKGARVKLVFKDESFGFE